MKVFYFIDENGEFFSEDKKVRYKALSGKELYNYFTFEENKRKYFYTDMDENGNVFGVETPEKYRATYCSEKRHTDYINKDRRKYVHLSLDMEVGENQEESLVSFIPDEDMPDAFDVISKREMVRKMYKILPTLTKEETDLIYKLYLSNDRMSVAEYADMIGVSTQVVYYHKNLILEKIKKYL